MSVRTSSLFAVQSTTLHFMKNSPRQSIFIEVFHDSPNRCQCLSFVLYCYFMYIFNVEPTTLSFTYNLPIFLVYQSVIHFITSYLLFFFTYQFPPFLLSMFCFLFIPPNMLLEYLPIPWGSRSRSMEAEGEYCCALCWCRCFRG